MNSKKGLSQVLSLIVAAAVLMMTALTVMMLSSSSLGGFGDSISGQQCVQSIRGACAGGAESVGAPSSCFTQQENGNYQPTERFSNSQYNANSPGQQITC